MERAILERARVLLLEPSHAAHRMFRLAVAKGVPSWASCVEAIMKGPKFSTCIPEVTSAPGVSVEVVDEARLDKQVRRKVLSDYK